MQLCPVKLERQAHLAFCSSICEVAVESFGRAPKTVSSVRNIEFDEKQDRWCVWGGNHRKENRNITQQRKVTYRGKQHQIPLEALELQKLGPPSGYVVLPLAM